MGFLVVEMVRASSGSQVLSKLQISQLLVLDLLILLFSKEFSLHLEGLDKIQLVNSRRSKVMGLDRLSKVEWFSLI
jgi:hypothetical protein